jgi:hypothetical protein
MPGSEPDVVTITVGPCARHARVARTVVASCASLERFDVDDLGDVRLLVDTAFHALIDIGTGPIVIRVEAIPGGLQIEMSAGSDAERSWDEAQLGDLRALVDVIAAERSFERTADRARIVVCVRPHGAG